MTVYAEASATPEGACDVHGQDGEQPEHQVNFTSEGQISYGC